jgi:predicted transcriptional regulator
MTKLSKRQRTALRAIKARAGQRVTIKLIAYDLGIAYTPAWELLDRLKTKGFITKAAWGVEL